MKHEKYRPCYQCPDRKAACHDTCPEYKAFKERLDAARFAEKVSHFGRENHQCFSYKHTDDRFCNRWRKGK